MELAFAGWRSMDSRISPESWHIVGQPEVSHKRAWETSKAISPKRAAGQPRWDAAS